MKIGMDKFERTVEFFGNRLNRSESRLFKLSYGCRTCRRGLGFIKNISTRFLDFNGY